MNKLAKERTGDLPSFVEHYQAVYSQKNQNEITEEEFRKLALATLELVEELFPSKPTAEDIAVDEYLMNYNPTQAEVEELEERVKESRRSNERNDVTETDHP